MVAMQTLFLTIFNILFFNDFYLQANLVVDI